MKLRRSRFLYSLVGGLLLLALLPGHASAHARLVSSTPPAGAILDSSPQEIDMSFTQAIALEFSAIHVLDRTRHEQSVGAVGLGAEGETSMRASITGTLQPGTYAVVWRVVSAVDGHLTSGSFVFRLKGKGESASSTPEPLGSTGSPGSPGSDASAPLEGNGETVGNPSVARWLLRAVILACITVCLGGAIFSVLVVEPTAGDKAAGGRGEEVWRVASRRFAHAGSYAAALLVVALPLDLLLQVADIGQTDGLGALFQSDLARLLLLGTRYGFAWGMKILAALLLLGILLFIRRSKRGGSGLWELCVAAGSLFLLAESLSSHAAAQEGDNVVGLPLPVVSDWLHLVTAATWVGGLVYMAGVLFPAFRLIGLSGEERRIFLAGSVPRFSRLALGSVLVLGVSGTYNLALHSTDLGAIAGSFYGQVLLIKIALFAVLVGLGAVNLVSLTPRLLARQAGSGQWAVGSGQETEPRRREGREERAKIKKGWFILPSVHDRPVFALRRNVRLEVAIMGVVLLCAGGLSLLPPPESGAARYGSTASAGVPGATPSASTNSPAPGEHNPAAAATAVAGYSIVLTTRPLGGLDELRVDVTRNDKGNSGLGNATRVVFVVTPQDIDAGGTVHVADRTGPPGDDAQTWTTRAAAFSVEGRYLVTVLVQRNAPTDLRAAFLLTLSSNSLSSQAVEYVDLRFTSDPDPPVVGSQAGPTHAKIILKNGEGGPILGAKVTVAASQPTTNLNIAAQAASPLPSEPGSYAATLNFPAAGDWVFTFTVEQPGQLLHKSTGSISVSPAFATFATPHTTSGPAKTPSP